ncbi:hypothetical protein PTSG_00707 [Salpingoeca rosetta]|uniref:RIIa domain-containing protein n=1 Tax=Salpingoeca rosetta (strain ATCC 50818 / BSB-021) TaxID=946362 RepID=F2TX91_SALR5|nr:uncharacterized protein PTSG_00707 [Salpingoeca rosetta]EGD76000.1 hypothetical protein PTSG_00707 [Salpingoeca rosetta]|eukprot:XP_004998175.1 hypothetical protein PTSG_00707 [Salpingoeca rosetta]
MDRETWEDDQEGWSMYLDKKAELKEEQHAYVTAHPELKHLVSDFLQHIIVRKPDDVYQAAKDYFAQFREDEDEDEAEDEAEGNETNGTGTTAQ